MSHLASGRRHGGQAILPVGTETQDCLASRPEACAHHQYLFSTNAEFFDPNAIVLQTAASMRARRPTSGT